MSKNSGGKIYRFGEMELNPAERIFLRDGKRLSLTPRMFDLLVKLVEADGRLLNKETLMNEVWADAIVEEGNLNRTISALRKVLGERKNENRFIETVPKAGYRFVAKVETVENNSKFQISNFKFAPTNDAAVSEPTTPLLPEEVWPQAGVVGAAGGQHSALSEQPALAGGFPMVESDAEKLSPAVRPNKRFWLIGAIAAASCVLAVLASSYFFLSKSETKSAAKNPNDEIVRLTNNQTDEEVMQWTNDNQIRFIRFVTNTKVESFVMNPDGGGEQRSNTQIKNLRTGTWSPDGKKVLFNKEGEKTNEIYVANADGSNEIKLPFRPGPFDWSPDGSQIVYNNNLPDANNSEIFIYNIETGKTVNISNSPTFDANPSFSPDGKQIVFNSNHDGKTLNIYLMNTDGSNVRRLTDHPAGEVFPVFTPDGTQILFNSRRENEKVGLYLINVNDNRPPVKISDTSYNSETRQRPFSPDGTRLIFTSDKDGDKFNIYVMNFEPFKPKPVLFFDDRDLQWPAYSPDGKKIVYQARLENKSGELCLFDMETLAVKTLLEAENSDLAPAFSPDGNLIAFNCKIDGNTDICTVKPDGSDLQNLTNHPAFDTNPTWSPDYREIIFASNRDEPVDRYLLFRMNSNGTNQRRVTQKVGYEMTPSWSPDGTKLAFSGDRADGTSNGLDIFLLDLANPNEEKILAVRRFHDTLPAFSPDGKRLAFVSGADGNAEIYLMNADGNGLLRITRNSAEDISPQFSRDGKKIIFSSNRSGKFAIYEVALIVN